MWVEGGAECRAGGIEHPCGQIGSHGRLILKGSTPEARPFLSRARMETDRDTHQQRMWRRAGYRD